MLKIDLMKKILIAVLILVLSPIFLYSQTTVSERVSYMKDYVNNIKSNIYEIKALLDSNQKMLVIDTLNSVISNLEAEINRIPIPAAELIPPPLVVENNEVVMDNSNIYDGENDIPNPETNDYGFGEKKKGGLDYLSFFKTKIYFNFGLNGLNQVEKNAISSLNPEINSAKSWFWTIGFKRPIRLSKSNDKVKLFYGLDYNENTYSIENSLRLYNNGNNVPTFITVDSLSNNNKLKIGYIRIPLELNFSFGRKYSLGLGGFVGYRVLSVQKFNYRKGGENIDELRYGKFGLNDWCYGGTASVGYGFFKVIGSYNFSNLLKTNSIYKYNPYSIGLSLVF